MFSIHGFLTGQSKLHDEFLPRRILLVEGSISAMHLAKDLEFRAVAVMACDDEVVPLQERIESVTDSAVPPALCTSWANRTRPPEFDTKRDKLLIHIGRASNLPLQEGQLGVLGRFSYVQSLQHLCLRVVNR